MPSIYKLMLANNEDGLEIEADDFSIEEEGAHFWRGSTQVAFFATCIFQGFYEIRDNEAVNAIDWEGENTV